MKSLNPYVTELSENRVSDGSGIRFGKYPKKRISGIECSGYHIFKSFVS
ncbi:hypothetical protein LA335_06660 [Bacteroides fragilis]|nr:hypothetical protein [Bacteroides fragilis]MCA5601027.1 hypothetical protein [Bacteroides fragilis]